VKAVRGNDEDVQCGRRDLQTDADYSQQADSRGFVAISYIAMLPAVQALTSDLQLVTSILQGQSTLAAAVSTARQHSLLDRVLYCSDV